MKLYMVTDGNYSDYHVCGIYSTEEKADWATHVFNTGGIEEIELDALPDGAPPGKLYFVVEMTAEGNTLSVRHASAEFFPMFDARPRYNYRPTNTAWVPSVDFNVWARDEEHAVKIANERRAMLIASGRWTTDWDKWQERMEADNRYLLNMLMEKCYVRTLPTETLVQDGQGGCHAQGDGEGPES